jgi:signal transduction histidine kinase
MRAGEIMDRVQGFFKKVPPRKDGVDMNEAVREVIAFGHSETVKNGISVQMHLGEHLPLVRGDRVQLQQVVLNLMMNAIQAMGAVADGARDLLITTAEAEPHGVLIAVKDSGPGLASANIERAFDPFYTTKAGGLGMGLSICRSIVEAHRGRLWVTPNLPRGAVFHFTVPADPTSAL